MDLSKPPISLSKQPIAPNAKIAILFSTAFGCGYSKKAPGTVGSIPGLLIGIALAHFVENCWLKVAILSALVLLSIWSIYFTEKAWDTHDDQRIVIDEVAGQAIAMAFLPVTPLTIIASFALFRFFDIWKPGPIGWADSKLPGVWGTLLDDLIAGVFAGLCCWALVTYVL